MERGNELSLLRLTPRNLRKKPHFFGLDAVQILAKDSCGLEVFTVHRGRVEKEAEVSRAMVKVRVVEMRTVTHVGAGAELEGQCSCCTALGTVTGGDSAW